MIQSFFLLIIHSLIIKHWLISYSLTDFALLSTQRLWHSVGNNTLELLHFSLIGTFIIIPLLFSHTISKSYKWHVLKMPVLSLCYLAKSGIIRSLNFSGFRWESTPQNMEPEILRIFKWVRWWNSEQKRNHSRIGWTLNRWNEEIHFPSFLSQIPKCITKNSSPS